MHLSAAIRQVCRPRLVRRIVRRLRRRSVAVLMYHGVTPEPLPVRNWCQVPAAEFERQTAWLAAHYRVRPLFEVVEMLERGEDLADFTACITFDDGFRNVATTAFPLLEKHRLPATVFVVTGCAESGEPPWAERFYHAVTATDAPSFTFGGAVRPLATPRERADAFADVVEDLKRLAPDARAGEVARIEHELLGGAATIGRDAPVAPMTWEDIARLAASGLVRFGAHGHTHALLPQCTAEKQREEIEVSRDLLRDKVGYADLFAYPNGSYDGRTKERVRRAGFRAAVTVEEGLNTRQADLFELKRVAVGEGMSMEQFELAVMGC